MAEIGLIASVIGVAAAGAKLSLVLYQFADAVGSAAQDVRNVASEISLFCSVLKQLDSTLRKTKAARYSLTALAAAETIVAECQRVFRKIQDLVDRLKRESVSSPEDLAITWTAKVKWVFQRSKILVYQRTLESMKTTLLLMLTTLMIAEKMSLNESMNLDGEGDQLIAQSLVITQQIALNDLRAEEEKDEEDEANEGEREKENEEVEKAPEIWPVSPHRYQRLTRLQGISSLTSDAAQKRLHRTSRVLGGVIDEPKLADSIQESQVAEVRTSLKGDKGVTNKPRDRQRVDSQWFSDTIFSDGLTPAARRESWSGDTVGTLASSQFRSLLSRWVDFAGPGRLKVRGGHRRYKSDNSVEKRPTQASFSDRNDDGGALGRDATYRQQYGDTNYQYPLQADRAGLSTTQPNPIQEDHPVSGTGRHTLHPAAVKAHPTILEFLLNSGGFDVDFKDHNGWTALVPAVEGNNEDSVRLLLEHGANPDATARCDCETHHKVPVSHRAAKMGYVGVLRMLLDAGADPHSRDESKNTLLIWAAECSDPRGLEMLLATGKGDVNAVNWAGGTAIFWAASLGMVECVKVLLGRADVDREIRSIKGENAKEEAAKKGHWEIVRLFEEDAARNNLTGTEDRVNIQASI